MSVTITKRVQFNGGARGRKRIEDATPKPEVPVGRVPRISRLMALTIHMQRLVDEGVLFHLPADGSCGLTVVRTEQPAQARSSVAGAHWEG